MSELASGGVSRSGRVRKKTAKLMEMESDTPSPASQTGKSTTKPQPDSESSKPPKKKIKIKLSLGPNPSIVDQVTPSESTDSAEDKKRGTIPPLKIPKSKITGVLLPLSSDKTSPENAPIISDSRLPEDIEAVDSTFESTFQEIADEEENNSKLIPNNNKTKKNEKKEESFHLKIEKSELLDEISLESEKSVSEATKMNPKTKGNNSKNSRKETESPANRIFRQITSGVTPTPAKKKTKSKVDLSYSSEEFEDNLVIATDDSKTKKRSSKPINKSPPEKKEEKKSKKPESEKPKKKRTAVITAYMLWSKENRSRIQQNSPSMDFAGVSRKLGEIWRSLAKNEKTHWKRKAQKLAGKGSSIISTGKVRNTSNKDQAFGENSHSLSSSSSANQSEDLFNSSEEPSPIGIEPIDVAAHLRLLGESLNIIGQRLKEHSGQIAVSGSLSVLLDSTLCAIGPLLCLTSLDPKLDGCSKETHKVTLDNIAYIMPGI